MAPVSGVIASAHVVAGQVVDAANCCSRSSTRPRLRIEALAFDAALAGNVGSASHAGRGNQRVPLAFVGAARSLREQACRWAFRAEGAALSPGRRPAGARLRAGQGQGQGIAVPVSSLMKNPANQTVVWVKTARALRAAHGDRRSRWTA